MQLVWWRKILRCKLLILVRLETKLNFLRFLIDIIHDCQQLGLLVLLRVVPLLAGGHGRRRIHWRKEGLSFLNKVHVDGSHIHRRRVAAATLLRLLGACQFQLDVPHVVALLAFASASSCLHRAILSLQKLLEVHLVLIFAWRLFRTLNTFH